MHQNDIAAICHNGILKKKHPIINIIIIMIPLEIICDKNPARQNTPTTITTYPQNILLSRIPLTNNAMTPLVEKSECECREKNRHLGIIPCKQAIYIISTVNDILLVSEPYLRETTYVCKSGHYTTIPIITTTCTTTTTNNHHLLLSTRYLS